MEQDLTMNTAREGLSALSLNSIHARNNYRRTFREQSLKELAQSIRENGVIEPILVRPNSDGYEIVAGERRYRAAVMAGLVTIPAMIREIADEDVLRVQIVENVQREGVPFMEEARGLRRLRDECALDVREIARKIGKSEAYVYFQIALTKMAADAQEACDLGELTKSTAWEIAKLPTAEMQSRAASDLRRKRKDKLITQRTAQKYIAETFGDDARPRKARSAVQKAGGNDYAANWKGYLVTFDCGRFEKWRSIVRGRPDIAVWSEAVEAVMLEGKR